MSGLSGRFYFKIYSMMYSKVYSVKIYNTRSLIISLLCAFLILSCSTVSPVTSKRDVPQRFDTLLAITPHWQSLSTEGLDFFSARIRDPRLEIWALRVDLTHPSLGIIISEHEAVNGVMQESIIPSSRVSSFTKRYNAVAGINTAPFRPVSGREGEERTIVGIAVSGGTLVAPPYSFYDALVFYNDGRAAIVRQSELLENPEKLENIENATGGFLIVLENGDLASRFPESGNVRHPRSAAGVSADGRTLYLLVIDGRRPGSIGATEEEIGIILKQLGAFDGINFDGGGSTALALRYPDGRVRVVNTPIHRGIPNRERAVATNLGITARRQD